MKQRPHSHLRPFIDMRLEFEYSFVDISLYSSDTLKQLNKMNACDCVCPLIIIRLEMSEWVFVVLSF